MTSRNCGEIDPKMVLSENYGKLYPKTSLLMGKALKGSEEMELILLHFKLKKNISHHRGIIKINWPCE